jgi:hypothetical protein
MVCLPPVPPKSTPLCARAPSTGISNNKTQMMPAAGKENRLALAEEEII